MVANKLKQSVFELEVENSPRNVYELYKCKYSET